MKNLRTLGMILTFLIGVVLCGEAAAARNAEVAPKELAVHKRASASSPVLTRLMIGQKVVVDSEASGWCQISVPGGKKPIGYVPCDTLKTPSSPQPAASIPSSPQTASAPSASNPPALRPASGPRPYSDITVRLYMADW